MNISFEDPNTWTGGHYELSMELGVHDNHKLHAASKRLWSFPELDGPYSQHNLNTSEQQRITDCWPALDHSLFGLAALPGRGKVPCGSVVIRLEGGSDWIQMYIPLGGLTSYFDLKGYPFSDEVSPQWRSELDSWLKRLATFTFEKTPFQVALLGFEVDFISLSASIIEKRGIPQTRAESLLWPSAGRLEWYPANA